MRTITLADPALTEAPTAWTSAHTELTARAGELRDRATPPPAEESQTPPPGSLADEEPTREDARPGANDASEVTTPVGRRSYLDRERSRRALREGEQGPSEAEAEHGPAEAEERESAKGPGQRSYLDRERAERKRRAEIEQAEQEQAEVEPEQVPELAADEVEPEQKAELDQAEIQQQPEQEQAGAELDQAEPEQQPEQVEAEPEAEQEPESATSTSNAAQPASDSATEPAAEAAPDSATEPAPDSAAEPADEPEPRPAEQRPLLRKERALDPDWIGARPLFRDEAPTRQVPRIEFEPSAGAEPVAPRKAPRVAPMRSVVLGPQADPPTLVDPMPPIDPNELVVPDFLRADFVAPATVTKTKVMPQPDPDPPTLIAPPLPTAPMAADGLNVPDFIVPGFSKPAPEPPLRTVLSTVLGPDLWQRCYTEWTPAHCTALARVARNVDGLAPSAGAAVRSTAGAGMRWLG
ncbi:hypothetical protein, partial [Catenulispora pinisilvae]|uniref:hypothetical protein n=1 Tax=Catenulispora pinisilvae TaxID=2705253 RepID=UPI001892305D